MGVNHAMQDLVRFGLFTLMGAVGTTAHYVLLVGGVALFGFDPLLASSAGAIVGALTNYMLNYRVTFRSSRAHRESAPRFAAIALAGIALNALAMIVCLRWAGLHYLLAQIISTSLVLVFGFQANRAWTFREG